MSCFVASNKALRRWIACLAVALCAATPAIAADPPAAGEASVDVKDVWRQVRHQEQQSGDAGSVDASEKPFFVVAPSLTSKPSTGVLVGVSSTLAFMRGDPATTHMSTATANAKISFKNQALSSVRFGTFSAEDKWFVQGDNRFQWTSLRVGALGLAAPSAKADLQYDWFRVYETAYRRIGDSRLFIGVGMNVNDHTDIRAAADSQVSFERTAYAAYSAQHQLAENHQVSSGTNVGLLFDTRDNSINAQRGWLANATYRTFFNGFLGGDSTWQELNLDIRTYRTLTSGGRQRLAFWFLGDFVTGGSAPYFDLPATSGDLYGRSARGYAEGFYRGPHLLYGETEYRSALVPSGLVGMVAFVNVTTVDGEGPGHSLFQSVAPGAGVGLRVLLDKHSRTNLCADYGVGRAGARGFYLAIQEGF
jgi:hypothetical protein